MQRCASGDSASGLVGHKGAGDYGAVHLANLKRCFANNLNGKNTGIQKQGRPFQFHGSWNTPDYPVLDSLLPPHLFIAKEFGNPRGASQFPDKFCIGHSLIKHHVLKTVNATYNTWCLTMGIMI